ncbi:hypothetical protein BBJ28_00016645 [Nothophytophthora sp. Chile5]|nr:hypothetical protein BBJ28_00016645 [Nothophytophthora sp. Chile5]
MSAMKMDFICKESPPEVEAARPAPSPTASPGSKPPSGATKMSALLNSSRDSDGETDPLPSPPLASASHTDADRDGASDNEDSEDEQQEHAAWQDVELNPAVELVTKLVRESLDAGKTYNKSITAKTSQLLSGCDSMLLELKSLSDARDSARQQTGKRSARGAAGCSCDVALAMLPLRNPDEALANVNAGTSSNAKKSGGQAVDDVTEDQTDRVLCKLEASMQRLRELAELIQATSMQGEANLISKVSLQSGAFQALGASIQASAAAATATAIAQERGRSSSAFGRLYMPLQVQKLQEWYDTYPRPLLDELTLMRTILNYRPYANPFQVGGLSLAHVRDWFKRRRHRERMHYVKLALEGGHDSQAAEEEIDLRLEQRIAHLRASVDPNELVKEVDRVRSESSLYDAAVNSFIRPHNLRAYVAASHMVPTAAEQQGSSVGGRGAAGSSKRPRTQESELDEVAMVKSASRVEVMALQNRIRSLLALPRSATTTGALQQVIDLLRAMKVAPDVRIQTGLVADLKQILKAYTKPILLRKATIALLGSLGMNRRAVVEQGADDEAPPAPVSPAVTQTARAKAKPKVKAERPRPAQVGTLEDVSAVLDGDATASPAPSPPSSAPPAPSADMASTGEPPKKKAKVTRRPAKSRAKKEKGRILRPMKFSMDQVTALEAWFQQKYKPSQEEMERYLDDLNAPPLRDMDKQPVDVNMTQLRRWFNKRRCLRRPPFALMTQQEAAKEGSKNPVVLKAVSSHAEGEEVDAGGDDLEIEEHGSDDDSSDDSSDDDDDEDDDDDDDSSDDAERLIDQSMA